MITKKTIINLMTLINENPLESIEKANNQYVKMSNDITDYDETMLEILEEMLIFETDLEDAIKDIVNEKIKCLETINIDFRKLDILSTYYKTFSIEETLKAITTELLNEVYDIYHSSIVEILEEAQEKEECFWLTTYEVDTILEALN